MQIINSLILSFLRIRLRHIRSWTENPLQAQERQFRRLISRAKNTAFGRQYDFISARTPDAFRNRVPLTGYDGMKPYVDRILRGEQNVLWPSPIRWFAKSSGTTSDKSKFIPVSREALQECHYRGGKDFLALYCDHHPDTSLFRGKGLIIGGSNQINQVNVRSSYGDLSAVLLRNLSPAAQWLRTPSLRVALMEEWEKKIECMARETIRERVTSISGVPTWTLVLMNKIFELTGKSRITDVWPHLEVYIHGGVSFEPYREQFAALASPRVRFYETYNASEGFFAFQDNLQHEGMLLLPDHGIFYEFIPLSRAGDDQPSTCLLHEVKQGENYALVISANSGLWRYRIGDTVSFTSLKPYRLRVTGRVKHFINAFGEEVMVDNTDKAMALACREKNAEIREYTVAPVYPAPGRDARHEWLIEFDREPDSIEEFTVALDRALQSLNSDYEAKRYKNIALKLPLVRTLRKGSFYDWMKANGKLGGQHKVPRLSNNREYVEDILRFVEGQDR